ncbi:MAG: sulfotransferase family protein [Pseudomonadota bacterium]
MALAVIGAGFGRTGTASMKLALEMLGLGPCHHMKEVANNPVQTEHWRAAARGDLPDWDEVFQDFGCSVDWPSSAFWRELSAHYPDAKILLTVRSGESWYRSIEKTILPVIQDTTDPDSVPERLIHQGVFGGRLADRAHAIAIFERNTAEVQAAIPPERLLTYRVGDGWEPLCRFLGRPVPDQPYPHTNTTEDFRSRRAAAKKEAETPSGS